MPPTSVRKLAPTAAICLGLAVCPLHAMNWEGHDDWMTHLPAAVELQTATPPTPPPLRRSRECRADMPTNPYEQIPLATDICGLIPPAIGNENAGDKP